MNKRNADHLNKECNECHKQYRAIRSSQKYCSYDCAGKETSRRKSKYENVDRTCLICQKIFNIRCCSWKCGALQVVINRGHNLRSDMTKNCKQCENEFTYKQSVRKQEHEFCTQNCANIYFASGRTLEKRHQKWIQKHGKEEADQRLEKMRNKLSVACTKNSTGRVVSPETRQKIREGLHRFFESPAGQAQIEKHTQMMVDGLASGRFKPFGVSGGFGHRNHIHGSYKGVYIRSSYEYGFIKKMEAQGLVFGRDFIYEDAHVSVPYACGGKSSRYFPDFYVKPTNTVYEVKPDWFVEDTEVQSKIAAAVKHLLPLGYKFEVAGEDFLQGFLFSRERIYSDPDFVPRENS